MKLTQIEQIMNSLNDVSNAGNRQQKRVKDILKLMKISISEHDMMMSVPEYVNNYIAFLGQDGLDTAIATRNNFEAGLNMFIVSGIMTVLEVEELLNK